MIYFLRLSLPPLASLSLCLLSFPPLQITSSSLFFSPSYRTPSSRSPPFPNLPNLSLNLPLSYHLICRMTNIQIRPVAQGLGAPAHKEGHAPGEAPVASDSGVTNVGTEGGSTNVPGEKGIGGVPVCEELDGGGNTMT